MFDGVLKVKNLGKIQGHKFGNSSSVEYRPPKFTRWWTSSSKYVISVSANIQPRGPRREMAQEFSTTNMLKIFFTPTLQGKLLSCEVGVGGSGLIYGAPDRRRGDNSQI